MVKANKAESEHGADAPENAVSASEETDTGSNGVSEAVAAEPTPDVPTSDEAKGENPWLDWLNAKIDTDKKAVLFVLAAGALLFFPFLGTLGLWDPWETHYGEVARAMIQRDDYLYPYWESAYFFSKPALTLWLMALGMLVTGAEGAAVGQSLGEYAEWGIRMPFALIAIGAMWAVYRIGKHVGDRTTGVICAIVLASCPQFIFIGKQAMTDGPLVGLMTIGMALFILAVFDDQEDRAANKQEKIITTVGILGALVPQMIIIGREMKGAGPELYSITGAGLVAAGFLGYLWVKATRRDCLLMGFYVLIGLAALSKGLAVLAVVGPVVLLYCLITFDWGMLLRSKFYIFGLLFLAIASPWYIVLTLFKGRDDEGLTFLERFWKHDNFSRVGAGVHGDRAGMSYFIEQLAYGMFPWAATLPFALGFAAKNIAEETKVARKRSIFFVLIWALWCYVFFTSSQTKFHHYIFPAVPALATLCGIWFHWICKNPQERIKGAAGVLVLALFAVIVRDFINEPRSLVNLFTYKYDRDFPRLIQPWRFIVPITVGGGLATIVAYRLGKKHITALAFALTAVLFGAWISHHHFNMLSPHWSQAHLFKTFYAEKKPDEPIYAYQLNWRGETFYSRNKVLQVKERGANQRIRNLVDQPGREFIITEQSRFHTLKNALSPDKRPKLQIIDRSSNKFYMCLVEE